MRIQQFSFRLVNFFLPIFLLIDLFRLPLRAGRWWVDFLGKLIIYSPNSKPRVTAHNAQDGVYTTWFIRHIYKNGQVLAADVILNETQLSVLPTSLKYHHRTGRLSSSGTDSWNLSSFFLSRMVGGPYIITCGVQVVSIGHRDSIHGCLCDF